MDVHKENFKKLIIVEDEAYMAEFLADIVKNGDTDVVLYGVYKNGREALSAIEQECPDIIVTDISMPLMDGLELIRKTNTICSSAKFIIISAYCDFHKVKEAFKLGANDYFLKSEFDEKEFISTINKIANPNGKEIKPISLNDVLLIKENLLVKYIWSGRGRESGDYYNIRLTQKNMCIMVAKISNYEKIEKEEWNGNSELLRYAILNVAMEMTDNEDFGDVCIKRDNEIVFAFSGDEFIGYINKIRSISTKTVSAFKTHFGMILSVGLSCCTNNVSELVNMYSQALTAADYAFVKGRGTLIQYGEEILIKGDQLEHEELYRQFVSYSENLEFHRMKEIIDIITSKSISINTFPMLINLFNDFFAHITNLSKKYNIPVDKHDFEDILSTGTLKSIGVFFGDVIDMFSQSACDKSDVVNSVKVYVDKNFSNDLKLQQIAKQFNMDYSYLSKRFAQKFNMSFSKYLNMVRMKYALELMMTSTLRLNEIACKAGFNSYENFSRAFQKKYGMWPKDFKTERGKKFYEEIHEKGDDSAE